MLPRVRAACSTHLCLPQAADMPALLLSLLTSAVAAGPSLDVTPWNSTTDRLLLYTLGKTGSTSLELAFGCLTGRSRLPFVRNIAADGIWRDDQYLALETPPRGFKTHVASVAQRMVEMVRPQDTNLWMIIPVRDTLARAMSDFFETLDTQYVGPAVRNWSLAQIMSRYKTLEPHMVGRSIIDTLQQVLGERVDWLPRFDPSSHDLWAVRGTLRLLIVRAEDSTHWPSIVERRMGVKIQLPSAANSGEDKWYGELYQAFKSGYVSEVETVRRALKSTDMRLLYTEDETNRFAASALHLR